MNRIVCFTFILVACLCQMAQAKSGTYNDPAGGTYYADVYMYSSTDDKSYGWCTGESDDVLERIIGLKTENGGVATTSRPGIKVTFCFSYKQAKDFDYEKTEYYVYAFMADGSCVQIGHNNVNSHRLHNDNTSYATLVSPAFWDEGDSKWASFRMYLGQTAIDKKIKSIRIIGFSHYLQDNFWTKDRDMVIRYRYDKDISTDYTAVPQPSLAWTAPGQVQMTMNHSAIPKPDADQYWRDLGTGNAEHRNGIGTVPGEYEYKGVYKVTVLDEDGNALSGAKTFEYSGDATSTVDIDVPLDQSFTVKVERSTQVKMRINYWNGTDEYSTDWTITENIPGSTTTTTSYNNDPLNVIANFNQVTGDVRLSWADHTHYTEGNYMVYRTVVDANGTPRGNRTRLATTAQRYYTDGLENGVEYGKRYRYEVFQKKDSWGDVEVPADAAATLSLLPTTLQVSTTPVIPLKLVQNPDVTDKVKIEWEFGGIPNQDAVVKFAVNRIEPDGTTKMNYGTVDVNRTAGTASFQDDKPENNCNIYRYFVTTDLTDAKLHYTSDTIVAHVLEGSVITGLTVSKGNYVGSTRLTWTAKQVGTMATTFDIKRRMIGSTEWVTIHTTQGTASQYVFIDETTEPGRFYEYRVTAYGADCDGTGMIANNYMEETGFGQASGVIAGRVSFDTGTAVSGVKVMLGRNGDEQSDRMQFYSRHIVEPGEGIAWHPSMGKASEIFDPSKPYTVSMWVMPDVNFTNYTDYAVLFSIDGVIELRLYYRDPMNYMIRPYVADGNGDYDNPLGYMTNIPGYAFTNVTLRYDGEGNFYLGNNTSGYAQTNYYTNIAATGCFNSPKSHDGAASITWGGGTQGAGNIGFTGFIDDVRVWSRSLTDEETKSCYDRILTGREEGLKAYYTFDEGLEGYAFDGSYTNGVPNNNHPDLGINTRISAVTPSQDQLNLYGVTNDNGEYTIRGIPFTGSGTSYTVRPVLGVHEFTPTSRTGFISSSSMSLNGYDFTDVSSFTVTGTVRYAGTTVPVDSVTFYIDGTPCTRDGKTIYSDENGEYTVSVPIGEHYIEAKRNGHTFEDEGRYPTLEGTRFDFRADVHLDFADNTLVNFSGRITGGATQGSVPLGYGRSENTIGKATLKLTMLDHPQRRINALRQENGTTVTWVDNPHPVTVESATEAIRSKSWRGYGDPDEVKAVYITTDSLTGEFSALLPPLRYTVESVKFATSDLGSDDQFRNIAAIDLTNPLDSVRADTLWNDGHTTHLPLYRCNKRLMLTYRSNPVFDVRQVGAPAGAFGTDTLFMGNDGEVALPLYTVNEATGAVTYTYGYPIFLQHRDYKYKIKLYEPYMNYDRVATGELYRDNLADSVITINNEMGEGAAVAADDGSYEGHEIKAGTIVELEPDQLMLDSIGEVTYQWSGGLPNLTPPYLRTLNIAATVGGRSFNWLPNSLEGIVLGVVPTGNNFITAGPTYVDMVLRDPPGSASTAKWDLDTVTTKYTIKNSGLYQNTSLNIKYESGVEMETILGMTVINTSKLKHEESVDMNYELTSDWDNTTYTTYTNSHSVSTSSHTSYVGSDGDVFIGHSTNFIIGAANEVNLLPQDDGTYVIGNNRCISMGEKFGTQFNYSQKFIENDLIPNIEATRNSMLTHITDLSQMQEHPDVPTYYTLLSKDDPNYGTSNDDEQAWGDRANPGMTGEMPSYYLRTPTTYNGCDSVKWFNESIRLWKDQLALNEQDKVEAFANDAKYKQGNVSFEFGNTVEASAESDSLRRHNQSINIKTGVVWNSMTGYEFDGAGFSAETSITAGYNYTEERVDEKEIKQVFSYTLEDDNKGESHTVDIYKSPRNWGPIFRTRAGQTRCPYEPEERTKYYEEGKHILNYGTMKIDNPKIDMPERNITDIPAGQQTTVKVWLTNESETQTEYSIVELYLDPESNRKGLVVLLDGAPLSQSNEIWIPYGQTLEQTLTIYQSDPSVLDYEDICLQILNPCQPGNAFDEVNFSVHFVAAAPAVTLTLDKNVLNQKAVRSGEQIQATISDINRRFAGLQGVRLKYRFIGDDNWIVAHDWVTSEQYLTNGYETDDQTLMPADDPKIRYTLTLPDIDGHYMVQAESYCGPSVVNATPEQEVIRDTRGPRLLGQAYPNTGVFTPTDDIHVRFNEAIRESYLTKDENFLVTGVLNDAPVNHEVSLQLNGREVSTQAYLPISDTDFSFSFWVKRLSGGTLVKHGTDDNYIALKVDDTGHAVIDLSGETVTSDAVIPQGKWVYVGASYKRGEHPGFNAFCAVDDQVTSLFNELAVPAYSCEGRLSVGKDLAGAMHQLSVWKQASTRDEMLECKTKNFPPYTPGLIGYWKMDEGHGTMVQDCARSRNMTLTAEQWNIDNVNLAAHLDGTTSLKADISKMDSRSTDSYVVETWFRGEPGENKETALLSITDNIAVGFDELGKLMLLTFDNPQGILPVNTARTHYTVSDVDYCDGLWHHFALNVRRGVSAMVLIDGAPTLTLAEQLIPAPKGDFLYVGSMQRVQGHEIKDTCFFKGDIDELRVWNVATDATTITNHRYCMVDTASAVGLVGYFPMQRSRLDSNGNIVTEFSLVNKALPSTSLLPTHAMPGNALTAPALKSAPDEQNIDFDFTASNDEIYITLRELPSRLHGNVINFSVQNVRDNCDNLSENISWSAMANYNSLMWLEDEMTLSAFRLDGVSVQDRLCNIGSGDDTFTISGAPSWLTVSPLQGNLDINGHADIEFTIQAGAPVGRHDVVIYACNSDGIYTPLHLILDIRGNEPTWEVDPSRWEQNMNIIGQFYIGDKIDQNPNTRVAAFVGDECRGVASPQLMASRDAYYVNLTVYGNSDVRETKPITFKIYSGEGGVVYNNVTPILGGLMREFGFQPNALIGNYDSPLKWFVTDEIEQTIDFKAGWNWISFYVKPLQEPMDAEMAFGHSDAFDRVNSKNDGFGLCDGSQWLGSLSRLDAGNMYKVRVNRDVTSHIHGYFIDPTVTGQEIVSGWNWIGPLSIYSLTIDEAFADLNPIKGDYVKSKEGISIYNGYRWEGTLTATQPGEGYYYYNSGDSKTFHYPSGKGKAGAPRLGNGDDRWYPFTPVAHQQFSDNMNVIARLMLGDTPVDTAAIGAFVDGQCRGVARSLGGLYYLTIAGDADESGKKVTFRTMIGDKAIEAQEAVTFVSDALVGNLDNPYLIKFSTSGLNDLEAVADVKVTPTLTTGDVHVTSSWPLAQVNVYTAGGAMLQRHAVQGDQAFAVSLDSHPQGVYLIEVLTRGGYRHIERVVLRP